jgi:hypothetical protein
MSLLSVLAIVLLAWGLITLVRGIAESEQQPRGRPAGGTTSGRAEEPADAPPPSAARAGEDTDGIDYEELERAEEEVRDLEANARPEDGFEGDDWGPGTPKKKPLY